MPKKTRKIKNISGKKLAKIIERLGFLHVHTVGSHWVYKHSDGRKTTIPIHSNETIGVGLLIKIIKKDLRMTKDEFLKLIAKRK
ncbi:MAG: type II toxin-antitoxin system HicA family toxin [Candidatus Woesearchaeota archaeon]